MDAGVPYRKAMLRVTTEEKDGEVRLRLEGRLAGPWVEEVERSWRAALAALGSRRLVVDLEEVAFVDAAGQELLAEMSRQGGRLSAGCPLMKYVISGITRARRALKLASVFLLVAGIGQWDGRSPFVVCPNAGHSLSEADRRHKTIVCPTCVTLEESQRMLLGKSDVHLGADPVGPHACTL